MSSKQASIWSFRSALLLFLHQLLIKLPAFTGLATALFAFSVMASTPEYIQGNYAVPQTSQTTVTVPFAAAQTAGNLNVVIVGWNDSIAHVSSLKDSNGNVYQLAVGPMVTGTLSQAIYYAKKISAAPAATNVVTVAFNTPAAAADIRVLEYSGLDPVNPLDAFVGAIGNSAVSSSGTLTTTATDLLVAANTVKTHTTGPGSGFTQRLLTSPDGDIVEDAVKTVAGSYSASAPLNTTSAWVMQMVAFRAAGTATPTPTPTPTPTSATPVYVQGNYAVPQIAQTTVTVPYTAAQTAGNLNVVIVGWNDSTAKVKSLADSNGNIYQLAIGPTPVTGALSQTIYYAKNTKAAKAGANAVTVTFSPAASYVDVRILEYSGIDKTTPMDAVVGTTGRSATSGSGTLKTTTPTDLLVGANTVKAPSTGPGSGFTQRLLTSPYGDIVEDQIVKAIGSYSATAPLGSTSGWVMQMVAFRAASSTTTSSQTPTPIPTPTPTPTATPKPTPTPTPQPTPISSSSSSITLAWSAVAPTGNPTTNTAGYRLHMGLASGVYTQITTLGNVTTVTVSKLVSGTVYYFVVTAYNSAGFDSPPSNQVSFKAP